MSESSDRRSAEFLKVAGQFKLGTLVTESSHPATATLSEAARTDSAVMNPAARTLGPRWPGRAQDGLLALAKQTGVALAGGDTAESANGVIADIVLTGSTPAGTALPMHILTPAASQPNYGQAPVRLILLASQSLRQGQRRHPRAQRRLSVRPTRASDQPVKPKSP